MPKKRLTLCLLAACLIPPVAPVPARAMRFIATPSGDVLPRGQWSLWQFGLYEQRSTKTWRRMNRFDLGLPLRTELGFYVISPQDKASETWTNVQSQILPEKGLWPSVTLGVWDLFHRSYWFGDEKGASPFGTLGKTYKTGDWTLKASVGYGYSRLHGMLGGAETRWKGTGIQLEHVPDNLRLPGTDAWDVGIYQWIGKYVRVRGAWMGGNPMLDAFFTQTF